MADGQDNDNCRALPAGAGVDLVARILADGFQKKWGNSVVVENRVGASGNIGQNYVAKAAPDGYTLIVSTPGPSANNMLTFKSLPYNPLTDFSFITTTNEDPMVIIAGPKLKAKDIKEFFEYVKANPGKLQFANPGHGTYAHMTQLSLQERLGTTFNLIPYKGSGQMASDMIGEQIDASIDLLGGYMEMVKAGKLRILTVIGDKRLPSLPDVPTLIEAGVNFTAQPWFGFEGPKGMDKDIIDQLNKAAVEIRCRPRQCEEADGRRHNTAHDDARPVREARQGRGREVAADYHEVQHHRRVSSNPTCLTGRRRKRRLFLSGARHCRAP